MLHTAYLRLFLYIEIFFKFKVAPKKHLPLGHQCLPFLEAQRPVPLILCYNTQANAIMQSLYYQETSSYVGVHYSCITQYGKLFMMQEPECNFW